MSVEGFSPTLLDALCWNNFLRGESGPYPNIRISWDKNKSKLPQGRKLVNCAERKTNRISFTSNPFHISRKAFDIYNSLGENCTPVQLGLQDKETNALQWPIQKLLGELVLQAIRGKNIQHQIQIDSNSVLQKASLSILFQWFLISAL